jgi:hypothetical protein|tara:strand:- start:76 stop:363 length:288 start_codon:yes stop_codon:yes gene_type:complete
MPFLSKLNKKVNILENNVRKIRQELDGPEKEPEAVGGITDATISTGAQAAQDMALGQLAQQSITPLGNFEPGTMNTAAQMFGTNIPGSFDRDMGN